MQSRAKSKWVIGQKAKVSTSGGMERRLLRGPEDWGAGLESVTYGILSWVEECLGCEGLFRGMDRLSRSQRDS